MNTLTAKYHHSLQSIL